MESRKINLDFKVGYMKEKCCTPFKYVPATVPGNAQLDWANAEGYPNYQFSDNYKMFAWMEDVFFKYTCEINKLTVNPDERIYFKTAGIDYKFAIMVNGIEILSHEGMFTPVKLDLTEILTSRDISTLDVIIYPAPKSHERSRDRSQADESVKPPVSYGWDWHPRLIPSGLYEECYLEVLPAFHIDDAEVIYTLSDDLSTANINLAVDLNNPNGEKGLVRWELFDGDDNIAISRDYAVAGNCPWLNKHCVFESPELWWCNGQGAQTLYKSVFSLYSPDNRLIDRKTRKIGFRRARLVLSPYHEDGTAGFPKTRNLPPVTIELNNRRTFAKGSNWLAPEIFIGTITKDTYEPQIKLAQEANFNMFRSWGGSMISKEPFFELCDEYGIMVWQEFPLSCNNYKAPPQYLDVLDKESRAIIKRVRRHACLCMWCGGNELFNSWSGMNDQSLALRLLNANCYQMDMHTPFLPTSPVYGMGHGSYVFRYEEGYDCLQAMVKAKKTAYTEFGNPGASDIEILKKIIPSDDLFPPKRGTAWQEHHAFDAWLKESWLHLDTIEHYFGSVNDLETLVAYSQMLQCIGYKGIFEEARRQYPYSSMALNWCYNEPWYAAANNSLLMYGGKPKPAYYAVQQSCRNQMISARVSKFDFVKDEVFEAEIFILNDLPEIIEPLTVNAKLITPCKIYELGTWNSNETKPGSNQKGVIFREVLDGGENCLMRLVIEAEGKSYMNSEYLFLYKNPGASNKVLPEQLA